VVGTEREQGEGPSSESIPSHFALCNYDGEHQSLDTIYNLKSEIDIYPMPKTLRRTPFLNWQILVAGNDGYNVYLIMVACVTPDTRIPQPITRNPHLLTRHSPK
jgi:hypothetical protein